MGASETWFDRLVGSPLPDLAFPATSGDAISLARQRARTVLFVYPYTGKPGVPDPPHWDEIPGAHGSTPQATGFAELHDRFVAAGIGVLGLSGQATDWQREAVVRLGLPFALLSDPSLSLAGVLGLPVFTTGGIRFYERLTLIIQDGVIEAVVHPVPNPATHAAELLARLGSSAFSAQR